MIPLGLASASSAAASTESVKVHQRHLKTKTNSPQKPRRMATSATAALQQAAQQDVAMPGLQQQEQEERELFIKSILHSLNQVRTLRAACMDTLRLPTSSVFTVKSKEAAKLYMDTVAKAGNKEQQNKKRGEMGPLHLHVWNAWVKEFADASAKQVAEYTEKLEKLSAQEDQKNKEEYTTQLSISQENVRELERYADWWKSNKNRMLGDCKVVRIGKCYNADYKKMEFACRANTQTEQVWLRMIDHLMNFEAAVYLPGVAPKGDFERRLQESLDDL